LPDEAILPLDGAADEACLTLERFTEKWLRLVFGALRSGTRQGNLMFRTSPTKSEVRFCVQSPEVVVREGCCPFEPAGPSNRDLVFQQQAEFILSRKLKSSARS
jgi:hypothetical protein